MSICLRRREFIAGLGGAAAWPLAARAQQAPMPVIGFLSTGPIGFLELAGFREGLRETGYVEGQNVAFEYRSAEIERGRLPELAADLIRRRVAVIFVQSSSATLAAKHLTATIPIVFQTSRDPVQDGLVASLSRPGGNVTGFTAMNQALTGKQLGLLRELLPGATRFAVLIRSQRSECAAYNPRRASGGDGHWAAHRSPRGRQQQRHRHGVCDPSAKAGRRTPR